MYARRLRRAAVSHGRYAYTFSLLTQGTRLITAPCLLIAAHLNHGASQVFKMLWKWPGAVLRTSFSAAALTLVIFPAPTLAKFSTYRPRLRPLIQGAYTRPLTNLSKIASKCLLLLWQLNCISFAMFVSAPAVSSELS